MLCWSWAHSLAQPGSHTLPDTRADARDYHFYDVRCPVPPIADMAPTTEITLTVLHQGAPLPCTGPAGSNVFKFVTKITSIVAGPGTAVVTGSGFGTASAYTCRLQRAGASAVSSAATFVSPTELRCNTTGAQHNRRHGDFAFTVTTAAGEVVPQYHSEELSSQDAGGFLIPTAQSSMTLEIDTCADRSRNNLETDVDCGGTACPGCGLGQRCAANSDCANPDEHLCLEGRCEVRDRDGDGQSEADGDCDDYDAARNSNADETRDGLDNNCDGQAADGDYNVAKFRAAPSQCESEARSIPGGLPPILSSSHHRSLSRLTPYTCASHIPDLLQHSYSPHAPMLVGLTVLSRTPDGGLFLSVARGADVWEFNSVSITSPLTADTIPQTNPITIYSLTDITISHTVGLTGEDGAHAARAGSYATRVGGAAARTALNRKGGNGHRCCGGHSESGVGPGGGGGGRYAGYGPGGGGAGHASAGQRGGRGNGAFANIGT